MFTDIFLAGLLLIAVIFDLKEERIPNFLIIVGLVFSLCYYISGGYQLFLFSLQGFATGIILLLIPFCMGGIGAGDVKLLGVIGAIKGSAFVFNSFLWMALWGGVIAVILLIINKQLKETFSRLGRGALLSHMGAMSISSSLGKKESSIYYPYAVAIGLGALSSYIQGCCL